jgi:hypothetical protein
MYELELIKGILLLNAIFLLLKYLQKYTDVFLFIEDVPILQKYYMSIIQTIIIILIFPELMI